MNKLVLPTIFICLVIANNVNWGVSGIDEDTDLNVLRGTDKKKFRSSASDLPDLYQFIESIPLLSVGEQILKEKCMKNSKLNNSYELTMEAKKKCTNCIKSLVRAYELENRISAIKINDYEVYKMTCKILPGLENCLLNYTSSVDNCLNEEDKIMKNVTI